MKASEKKILTEIVIAIGMTLDSIDVRASSQRRFEAKKKAERQLERLLKLIEAREVHDQRS